MRLPLKLLPVTLILFACDGTVTVTDDPDDKVPLCAFEEPPAPPSFVTPADRELIQPEDALRFEASVTTELGDAREAEFELHLVANGQPILKVWSAQFDDAGESPTIDLDEGRFETGFVALDTWQSYAVRARYRDGGDLCDYSEWSDFREFRIDDGSEALFDESIIRDVEIALSQESFDLINAEALPPGCVPYHRPYHPGDVTFDGNTYEGAGVRVKGGCGSSRNLGGKASFKINLNDYTSTDTCPESRRARGMKRITVNNGVQDRSHTHERLAYDFYDLVGVPVPRRAPIRVHVNDELWGLYLHLESIDRRFLQRRYEGIGGEGMLYEGTYFCDMTPNNLPGDPSGPETCFGSKFTEDECSTPNAFGDPYTYAPLISFVNRIDALPDGGFYPAITEFVDFDAYLSQWAAETIMNHWDGAIFDIRNNYRVYHDPVYDKWVVIPTGMDQSWNAGQRPIDPWVPGNIIARRCLQEKPCEDAFAARLKEVLTVFENADFAAKAEAIRTQIADEVAADPRKEGNDFSQRVDNTITFIQNRPAQVNAWLAEHGY